MKIYSIVFDNVMLKQLKQLGTKRDLNQIISKMLDKIESKGAGAGNLLDSRLSLYEIKSKKPPIRLYFKLLEQEKEAYVFQYEFKTSSKKQRMTLDEIRNKIKDLF